MENNDLKEKIQKNVKERIAIANIRKEFKMKNSKNNKLIYWITSSAAIVIIGFGIIMGTDILKNPNYEIASLNQEKQKNEENLKIDLQINKIKEMGLVKSDADIETIDIDKIPEEVKFMENIITLQEFKQTDMYNIYVRSNPDTKKYDLLHDYVFVYKKDKKKEIRISLSKIEEPIRDYYLGDNHKTSKIGETELKISEYKEMYMATFKIKKIYFDIETNDITENELVELLQTIITKSK